MSAATPAHPTICGRCVEQPLRRRRTAHGGLNGHTIRRHRGLLACGWAWRWWWSLLDQFSKTLIIGHFQLGDSRTVTSFFNLVRVHNTGAAFSFLAGASGWQRWFFVGLGTVASGFIVWMLKKPPDAEAVLLRRDA